MAEKQDGTMGPMVEDSKMAPDGEDSKMALDEHVLEANSDSPSSYAAGPNGKVICLCDSDSDDEDKAEDDEVELLAVKQAPRTVEKEILRAIRVWRIRKDRPRIARKKERKATLATQDSQAAKASKNAKAAQKAAKEAAWADRERARVVQFALAQQWEAKKKKAAKKLPLLILGNERIGCY